MFNHGISPQEDTVTSIRVTNNNDYTIVNVNFIITFTPDTMSHLG